jgi:hypothetical protein
VTNKYKKEELKAAAQEAYGKLRSHELVWILDAAIKHFEESTKRYQDDLVRYEKFPPKPEAHGETSKVERAQEALERYGAVLNFLEPLKWLLVHMDAEAFGEDMRAHFFGKKLRVAKK